MEENGVSLFQGSGAIEFSTDELRRQEEEDDEEEQKRRNEEINSVLKDAFDDLDNENEADSSISSSYHRQSNNFHSGSSNYYSNQNGDLFENNRKNSVETVITLGRRNLQNGYESSTRPIRTPSDTESNKENSAYNYPCTYQTPANHYAKDKDFARKNCFNGDFEVSEIHKKSAEELSSYRDIYSNSEETYKFSEYHSKEQLEVLLMVRLKELDQLTRDYRQLEVEKDEEKNRLERKLAIAQAEIQQSNISRDSLQNALVDAKAEIADLQNQFATLAETSAVSEKSKQNKIEELELAKNTINELQQKISALSRVQSQQITDKMQEKYLQQTLEKHNIELQNMQTQIDVLTNKLSDKESSYNQLEQKYNDTIRANEALLIEKSETINKFAKALEESQNQCRNLMSNGNSEQVCLLENRLKALTKEKDEILQVCQDLEHKLQLAKTDSYYNLLMSSNPEGDSTHAKNGSASPKDLSSKLHSELQRCLAGQAAKRKEISRLENIISQRDEDLRRLENIISEREKELMESNNSIRALKQETDHYRRRVDQLEKELKSLLTDQAKKADEQIRKLADHLEEVTKKYNKLKADKENLEGQLQSYELQLSEIKQVTSQEMTQTNTFQKDEEKEEQKARIIELTIQLEQMQKELNHVKELYIEVCGAKARLLNEHQIEIKKLKDQSQNTSVTPDVEKLQQEHNILLIKNTNLTKECETCRSQVKSLEEMLKKEMKKNDDLTNNLHADIEKAKKEAIEELRITGYTNTSGRSKTPEISAGPDKLKNVKSLLGQIKSAKSALAQVEKTESTLRAEVRKIMYDKKRIEEKCSTLEIVIRQNQKLNNLQETKIRQLESELTNLKRRSPLVHNISEIELKNIKEATVKEIRQEMEQKIIDELKNIENQYKKKQEKLEGMLAELTRNYEIKTEEFENFKETSLADKVKCLSSMKAQEQIVAKMIEAKMKNYQDELYARKMHIDELQQRILMQQAEINEEKIVMAEAVEDWVREIKDMKQKSAVMEEKTKRLEENVAELKEAKEKYLCEIQRLEESQRKSQEDLDALRKKYNLVKGKALSYKEYAQRKENHVNNEFKRLEADYKKSLGQLQSKVEMIVSNQRDEVAQQLQEIRDQYDERLNKNLSKKKKG